MQGFFDLETPEHLLCKLERDYECWRQDPVNVDLAWNFFVTAEHLPDWLYWQDAPHKRPDLLNNKQPRDFKHVQAVTRICSHLANGGKHFKPNPYDVSANRVHGFRRVMALGQI